MVILYKRIKFSLWPENHVVDTKYDTFSRCIDLDSQNPWPDMSGVIDHKWAGILKLRIKGTDRHIVLVNTHLVTDTRDAAYPGMRLPIDEGLDPSSGRNKRWEFRWLLHYLTSYIYRGDIRPSDAIILGGDLNTKYRVAPGEIYGDRDIFGNQFNGAIGLTSERALMDSYMSSATIQKDHKMYTSGKGSGAKIIDYLFHSENLQCQSVEILQPSDTHFF